MTGILLRGIGWIVSSTAKEISKGIEGGEKKCRLLEKAVFPFICIAKGIASLSGHIFGWMEMIIDKGDLSPVDTACGEKILRWKTAEGVIVTDLLKRPPVQYVLNETANRMWELLVGQKMCRKEVIDIVMEEFNCDPETITRDIDELVEDLAEAKFIDL